MSIFSRINKRDVAIDFVTGAATTAIMLFVPGGRAIQAVAIVALRSFASDTKKALNNLDEPSTEVVVADPTTAKIDSLTARYDAAMTDIFGF